MTGQRIPDVRIRCGILDGGTPHGKLLGVVGVRRNRELVDMAGIFGPLTWAADGRQAKWKLLVCEKHGIVGVPEEDILTKLDKHTSTHRAPVVLTKAKVPKTMVPKPPT